eukprot:jgi/Mesen1/1367/ME000013S00869
MDIFKDVTGTAEEEGHPYTLGYEAVKRYKGRFFTMTVHAGPQGPVFQDGGKDERAEVESLEGDKSPEEEGGEVAPAESEARVVGMMVVEEEKEEEEEEEEWEADKDENKGKEDKDKQEEGWVGEEEGAVRLEAGNGGDSWKTEEARAQLDALLQADLEEVPGGVHMAGIGSRVGPPPVPEPVLQEVDTWQEREGTAAQKRRRRRRSLLGPRGSALETDGTSPGLPGQAGQAQSGSDRLVRAPGQEFGERDGEQQQQEPPSSVMSLNDVGDDDEEEEAKTEEDGEEYLPEPDLPEVDLPEADLPEPDLPEADLPEEALQQARQPSAIGDAAAPSGKHAVDGRSDAFGKGQAQAPLDGGRRLLEQEQQQREEEEEDEELYGGMLRLRELGGRQSRPDSVGRTRREGKLAGLARLLEPPPPGMRALLHMPLLPFEWAETRLHLRLRGDTGPCWTWDASLGAAVAGAASDSRVSMPVLAAKRGGASGGGYDARASSRAAWSREGAGKGREGSRDRGHVAAERAATGGGSHAREDLSRHDEGGDGGAPPPPLHEKWAPLAVGAKMRRGESLAEESSSGSLSKSRARTWRRQGESWRESADVARSGPEEEEGAGSDGAREQEERERPGVAADAQEGEEEEEEEVTVRAKAEEQAQEQEHQEEEDEDEEEHRLDERLSEGAGEEEEGEKDGEGEGEGGRQRARGVQGALTEAELRELDQFTLVTVRHARKEARLATLVASVPRQEGTLFITLDEDNTFSLLPAGGLAVAPKVPGGRRELRAFQAALQEVNEGDQLLSSLLPHGTRWVPLAFGTVDHSRELPGGDSCLSGAREGGQEESYVAQGDQATRALAAALGQLAAATAASATLSSREPVREKGEGYAERRATGATETRGSTGQASSTPASARSASVGCTVSAASAAASLLPLLLLRRRRRLVVVVALLPGGPTRGQAGGKLQHVIGWTRAAAAPRQMCCTPLPAVVTAATAIATAAASATLTATGSATRTPGEQTKQASARECAGGGQRARGRQAALRHILVPFQRRGALQLARKEGGHNTLCMENRIQNLAEGGVSK